MHIYICVHVRRESASFSTAAHLPGGTGRLLAVSKSSFRSVYSRCGRTEKPVCAASLLALFDGLIIMLKYESLKNGTS